MNKKEFFEIKLDTLTINTSKFIGGKYLRKYVEDNGLNTDADVKEAKDMFKDKYTLNIIFDYEGVSGKELLLCSASTTTFNKQLYNNVISNWSKEEAESYCKQPYEVSVKSDIIDAVRKREKLSFSEHVKRLASKELKKGKSKEEVKATIESFLNDLQ